MLNAEPAIPERPHQPCTRFRCGQRITFLCVAAATACHHSPTASPPPACAALNRITVDSAVQPIAGEVHITIVDARTKRPIPLAGATIVPGPGEYGLADSAGLVVFPNAPAGWVFVIAGGFAHQQLTDSIYVPTSGVALQVFLTPAAPEGPCARYELPLETHRQ